MLAFLDSIPYGTPRLRRLLFWLLFSFTAYVLIGFLVVPPALKSLILNQCKTVLGREATVGRVAFNPLTLRLEMEDITVAKLEGDGNLFSVDRIDASPGLASLWKLAPVISHLHLRSPQLDITFFGEGKYSISDLIGTRDPGKRETPPTEEATAVFPFAMYGFEMTNATIVFDDRPHQKKHVISQLDLMVPFTSSFLHLRKEFTQPKFSAVINGDPVSLTGRTLPFDETMLTEFKLGAVDVDLHQYWSYLPVDTPLVLQEGRFTSEISLFFERPDAQRLNLFLGGGGRLTGLKLADKKDGTVLTLQELAFNMEKYSLGDNELVLTDVTLDRPYFKIIRRANDDINWAGYFPGTDSGSAKPEKNGDKSTDLILAIRKLVIAEGKLDWQDLAVPGGFQRTFHDMRLTGSEIATHGKKPCSFTASVGKEETLTLSGSTTLNPLEGTATLGGTGLQLPGFNSYFGHVIPLLLDSGTLDFSASVAFGKAADTITASVHDGSLSLTNLALRQPKAKTPSLTLAELAVSGTEVDLKGKEITVGEVRLTKPDIKLVREKSGELDLARLFTEEGKPAEPSPAPDKDETPGWTGTIKGVRLTDGTVSLRDLSLKTPLTFGVNNLSVDLDNVTTRQEAAIPYTVKARWGDKGDMESKGTVVLQPLKTSGTLALRNLSLRPLDGFLAEHTELLFASGAASADLKYDFSDGDKITLSVTGDSALTDVRFKDNRGGGEILGVEALKLSKISLTGEPYRLEIGAIHLHAPTASVNYDEKGHSNIRHAFRLPQPLPGDDGIGSGKTIKDDKKQVDVKPEKEQSKPVDEPEFFDVFAIGKISMEKGVLRFRDASVTPPYSSVISDITFGLVDIAQSPEARPKMILKAKIGPTPMSVSGICNPLITPIYSDLAISVSGLEMITLTPYTLKNLGYPIEKGRLYADVKFKTEDWILSADNKFFIEQMVLGPKDKRPGAPNVPVQFGLSLLQDSKGDIELDLPIKGRLDDPDFRVGGIVFRTITSLLFKALASPFSLIGSIFGGGDKANMDFVLFDPGSRTLDAAGREKLDTVAKALKARERLKLEVDGVIDPKEDKAGLIRHTFKTKLKQQKYESLPRKEREATTVEATVIKPEEYEELLFKAYKDEDDKEGVRPTSLFVIDRQPAGFMERFILNHITITDQDLAELAVQRARVVKEYLIAKEPSLTPRVFLLDRKKDRKGKTGVPRHRADLGIK